MDAVILAAGRGTRMGELTKDKPKCLLEVGGETILHRMVRQLVEAGIERVVVIGGYKFVEVAFHLMDMPWANKVSLVYNPDHRTTNNAKSLLCAKGHVKAPFLLVHGDLVCDSSWIDKVARRGWFRPVLAVANSEPLDAEAMQVKVGFVHDQGRVLELKKFADASGHGEYIGLAWITEGSDKRLFDACEAGGDNDWYDTALDSLLSAIPVGVVLNERKPWAEIDTPEDLERARQVNWR